MHAHDRPDFKHTRDGEAKSNKGRKIYCVRPYFCKAFCFCECLRSGNLRSTLEMISCNYAFAWCMDGFKSCLINCALQEWQRVGKQIPKISIRANRDSTKSTALVFGKISFICAICKAASRLQRDIAKFIGVDRFPAALVRRGEKNWECISFTHFSYCQSEHIPI